MCQDAEGVSWLSLHTNSFPTFTAWSSWHSESHPGNPKLLTNFVKRSIVPTRGIFQSQEDDKCIEQRVPTVVQRLG